MDGCPFLEGEIDLNLRPLTSPSGARLNLKGCFIQQGRIGHFHYSQNDDGVQTRQNSGQAFLAGQIG